MGAVEVNGVLASGRFVPQAGGLDKPERNSQASSARHESSVTLWRGQSLGGQSPAARPSESCTIVWHNQPRRRNTTKGEKFTQTLF